MEKNESKEKSINIRIKEKTHKIFKVEAAKQGKTLPSLFEEMVNKYCDEENKDNG